jgi:uncharacterized membrane protein YqhA
MPEGTEHQPPGGPTAPEHMQLQRAGFFEQLLKIRYIAAVVVILSLLHSLTFLYMGARIAVATYWHVLSGATGEAADRPGVELLHSLDFFLVSLVLMILALGIAKLFLLPSTTHRSSRLPSWLSLETFSDLKFLLWETILTTLLIAGLPMLSAGLFEKLDWTALLVPAAILLLAFSLYLMKKT